MKQIRANNLKVFIDHNFLSTGGRITTTIWRGRCGKVFLGMYMARWRHVKILLYLKKVTLKIFFPK